VTVAEIRPPDIRPADNRPTESRPTEPNSADPRPAQRPKWPALSYLARYEWRTAARPGGLRPAAPGVGRALGLAAGVLLPLLLGVLLGQAVDGVFAALGALLAGLASLQGVTRTRMSAVAVAGIGAAVSTFVGGTVAYAQPWALVPVIILWGYVAGLTVCLGQRRSAVAALWPVALLIAVGTPLDPAHAATRAGLVLAGTAVQGIVVALSWTARRGDHERAALEASFRHLADYAWQVADGRLQAPAPVAFPAADRLADPNPLLARGTRRAYVQLLEHAEQARAALAAVAVHGAADPAARRLAADSARALDAVADALTSRHFEPAADLPALGPLLPATTLAATATATDSAATADSDPGWRWAADALLAQLRAVTELLANLDHSAPSPRGRAGTDQTAAADESFSAVRRTLRANLAPVSETGRHALRLALTAGVAETLVRMTGLYEGRWVVLTVFLVLKPDYTSTVSRGVHRALGTAAGAVFGAVITILLHGTPIGIALAGGIAVAAAYAVFQVDYLVYSFFLTVFIVLLLHLVGLSAETTATARLADTAIGAALALVAYALWPTWHGRTASRIFDRLVEAHTTYATALLRELDAPGENGPQRLRALQSAARRSRTDAEAAAERLAAEPSHPAFTPQAARAVVASATRLAHTELSLHTLATAPARPADPSHVRALADDTRAALAELAELADPATLTTQESELSPR
jgi:uncharacterized membrane protein YccC